MQSWSSGSAVQYVLDVSFFRHTWFKWSAECVGGGKHLNMLYRGAFRTRAEKHIRLKNMIWCFIFPLPSTPVWEQIPLPLVRAFTRSRCYKKSKKKITWLRSFTFLSLLVLLINMRWCPYAISVQYPACTELWELNDCASWECMEGNLNSSFLHIINKHTENIQVFNNVTSKFANLTSWITDNLSIMWLQFEKGTEGELLVW